MNKIRLGVTGIICAALTMLAACSSVDQTTPEEPSTETTETTITEVEEEVEERNMKLPSVNISPNDKLTSPVGIQVNSEGAWFASEGELGTVHLMNDQGEELGMAILSSSDGNWMTSDPAMFDTQLEFDAAESGSGKLVVKSNPGEGDGDEAGEQYSFEIPVTF